jgi:TM2 domain-containing membrane protein YozV
MIEATAPTIELPPAVYVAPAVRRDAPDTNDLIRFEAEKKSAGLAFALCWFLGIWGAHRFYLKRSHGLTMLLTTIVSLPLCFLLVGLAGLGAIWIWMIVDLFSVSGWVRAYNTSLLARITSTQTGSSQEDH